MRLTVAQIDGRVIGDGPRRSAEGVLREALAQAVRREPRGVHVVRPHVGRELEKSTAERRVVRARVEDAAKVERVGCARLHQCERRVVRARARREQLLDRRWLGGGEARWRGGHVDEDAVARQHVLVAWVKLEHTALG